MKLQWLSLSALSAVAFLSLGLAGGMQAQQAGAPKPATSAADAPVVHDGDVPAYHASLPKGGVAVLPQTLDPRQFSDPRIANSYAMAAKVRGVLYQQPCFCHCDKEVGHHSLLDCFAGDHASICETCMMEGVFAYNETRAGKNATQIRAEIKRGEWKNVNLNDLLTPRVY